jgi:hypothetical protein
MRKRLYLYGGTILLMLTLLVVLSDRHVVERAPFLGNVFIRLVVIVVATSAIGSTVRWIAMRRRAARAA